MMPYPIAVSTSEADKVGESSIGSRGTAPIKAPTIEIEIEMWFNIWLKLILLLFIFISQQEIF